MFCKRHLLIFEKTFPFALVYLGGFVYNKSGKFYVLASSFGEMDKISSCKERRS